MVGRGEPSLSEKGRGSHARGRLRAIRARSPPADCGQPAGGVRPIGGKPGGSRMLALISAAVTLANLLLSLVIGIRLFRLARRGSGFGPEFWLAGFFLLRGLPGRRSKHQRVCRARGSHARAELVLPRRARARRIDLHLLRWEPSGCTSSSGSRSGASRRARAQRGRRGQPVRGRRRLRAGSDRGLRGEGLPGHRLLGRSTSRASRPITGSRPKSLRYWAAARRRMRLGLADPLVTNRFLLLGLWAVAWAAMGFSDILARGIYWAGRWLDRPRCRSTRPARSSS